MMPASYMDQAFDLEAFGADVRKVRKEKGLSLRAASDEVGIAFNTFYRIEVSLKTPSVENAARVAMWADLSLDAYKRFRRPIGGATK